MVIQKFTEGSFEYAHISRTKRFPRFIPFATDNKDTVETLLYRDPPDIKEMESPSLIY